jgi:hypothetical protein
VPGLGEPSRRKRIAGMGLSTAAAVIAWALRFSDTVIDDDDWPLKAPPLDAD